MGAESMRNVMMATCQRLELWPPTPTPNGIADTDCCYKEIAAPIEVIAQRLYNDETRREERAASSVDGVAPMRRKAATACFIVDFAGAAGVTLPAVPKTFLE